MKNKILLFVIKTAVSITLIGFLFAGLGKENLLSLPSYLDNASYLFLAVSILIFISAVALSAVRWGELLEIQGIKFKFPMLLRLTFVGCFFSNFLPGSVGGDAVKLFYTARSARRTAGPLVSILLDRILGVAALLVIAVFALPFSFNIPEIERISLFILILFVLFLIAVFLFFNLKKSSVLRRIFKIGVFDLGNKIKTLKNTLVVYRNKKNILAYTFSIALVIQFLIVAVCYFVALFLNLRAPFRYFLVFIPIIQLVSFLPVTISGIGTREWAFVLFFTTASQAMSQMDAFALSVGFYLVSLISSLPGAIAYLLIGTQKSSSLY